MPTPAPRAESMPALYAGRGGALAHAPSAAPPPAGAVSPHGAPGRVSSGRSFPPPLVDAAVAALDAAQPGEAVSVATTAASWSDWWLQYGSTTPGIEGLSEVRRLNEMVRDMLRYSGVTQPGLTGGDISAVPASPRTSGGPVGPVSPAAGATAPRSAATSASSLAGRSEVLSNLSIPVVIFSLRRSTWHQVLVVNEPAVKFFRAADAQSVASVRSYDKLWGEGHGAATCLFVHLWRSAPGWFSLVVLFVLSHGARGSVTDLPGVCSARHTRLWISDDDALSFLLLLPFFSFLAAFMTAQALAHPANVRKMIANGDVEPVRVHSSPSARIVFEGALLCRRSAHSHRSSTRCHVFLPPLRTAHAPVCVCGLRASCRKRSEGGEVIGVLGLHMPRLALPAMHLPCDVSGGSHPAIVIGRVRAWTSDGNCHEAPGLGWRVAACDGWHHAMIGGGRPPPHRHGCRSRPCDVSATPARRWEMPDC